MWLKVLTWEDYPSGPNYRAPYETDRRVRKDVPVEAEVRVILSTSQGMWAAFNSW